MGDDEAERDSAQSSSNALRTGGDRTSRDGALDRTEVLPADREPAEKPLLRTEPLGTARTAPL